MEKEKTTAVFGTAGIVTYNPELQRLKSNIDAIAGQVERVYVFDNGSSNIADIKMLVSGYANVSLILSEKMFIDGVDFDICYNMRRCGYKIVKIPFEGVLQEVGKGRNVKLLGKEYIIYNHSPFRCYYIARNNIYLAKKYKEVSMAHMIAKEAAAEVLTLLYEDNKFAKLKKRWQGLAAGICMKVE